MTLRDVIEEIKAEVYAFGTIRPNLNDAQLNSLVYKCIRELQRYYDESTKITVPFKKCIDLTGFKYISIIKVYRTEGFGNAGYEGAFTDPAYAQQWMIFNSLGSSYNLQDYVLNYGAWCTLNQIRNTISTDLDYEEDKHNSKLYINVTNQPTNITIEYIPKIMEVEDIASDRWLDILIRMSIAMTKLAEGRLKTNWKQSGALYENSGETLLQEGKEELDKIREKLEADDCVAAPID